MPKKATSSAPTRRQHTSGAFAELCFFLQDTKHTLLFGLGSETQASSPSMFFEKFVFPPLRVQLVVTDMYAQWTRGHESVRWLGRASVVTCGKQPKSAQ